MISPVEITAPVEKLIARIGSEYAHEIISAAPDPDAIKGSSYVNVQQKVDRQGGNLVYGWAVWQDVFICEGRHYAVWEDEDGNLTDITPHHSASAQLLFVPDDRLVYDGQYIASIRISVVNNPLAEHLILLSEMKDFLLQFATHLDDDKINFNTFTGNMYTHYDTLRENVSLYLEEGGKLGSPSYCKSLKPYSQCHGKNLLAAIEVDRKNVVKMNGGK